jgi:hypothetical protein
MAENQMLSGPSQERRSMSDWADDQAWELARRVRSASGFPPEIRRTLATALRAAERKGLERALDAAKSRYPKPGPMASNTIYAAYAVGEHIAKCIQSLIDKPETEERKESV